MTEPTVRQLIEQHLCAAHFAGLMNSNAERRKYVNAMVEVLRLAKTATAADLAPAPAKERLAPIPLREVIDSLPKLHAAREKLARLEVEERRLTALAWNKQTAADDEKLRVTRSEIINLGIEIKIASAMEKQAHV